MNNNNPVDDINNKNQLSKELKNNENDNIYQERMKIDRTLFIKNITDNKENKTKQIDHNKFRNTGKINIENKNKKTIKAKEKENPKLKWLIIILVISMIIIYTID